MENLLINFCSARKLTHLGTGYPANGTIGHVCLPKTYFEN